MNSGGFLFIFRVSSILLICPFSNISAQNKVSENFFYQQALTNARSVYHTSFGDQSALFSGKEFGDYLFGFETGQPFFNSAQPVMGSVIYDGISYDSILMRYDEIKDAVVINHFTDKIQLANEKIQGFNLHNSTFIPLIKDSVNSSLVSSGFYNLLYKGKVTLVKKEIKFLIEKTTMTAELLRIIEQKDYYYIKKEDKFYPIKSKKNLLEIFADNKKEVQKFISANGFNFRKDPQNMLTKTTAYYDSLKK
jgi:hypothetical protein